MNGFLASVRTLAEARTVYSAGADIIDLKEPAAGALGALDTDTISQIAAEFNGHCLLSATIGDQPLRDEPIAVGIEQFARLGVDFIKVGWFGSELDSRVLASIGQAATRSVRIIVVVFAELGWKQHWLAEFKNAGVHGVMLDTADKSTGGLLDKTDLQSLQAFVDQAQRQQLLCGLAGALKVADIPGLLPLGADYLGFRTALCQQGQRSAEVDSQAVETVRIALQCHHDAQLQAG